MRNTAFSFQKTDSKNTAFSNSIPARQIKALSESWSMDCEVRDVTPATLANRRETIKYLLWYLRDVGAEICGREELKGFFHYAKTSHLDGRGRWGNPAKGQKELKPSTRATYHRHLSAFFNYLVEEEMLDESPLLKIKPPIVREDQIQPLTDEQCMALIAQARKSSYPDRDTAIVMLLLDSGVRATELCTVRFGDVDIVEQSVRVMGKGRKERTTYFGRKAKRALWRYIRIDDRKMDDPLFWSEKGAGSARALTASGLLQLIERLAIAAQIKGVRCSPHTFRHTFAINYLRNGGDMKQLMTVLGHTSVKMTLRYLQYAQADLQRTHRKVSPVDRL